MRTVGSRKLTERFIGPFVVNARVGSQAYRLDLPSSLRALHPVFHISRLRPYRSGGGDGTHNIAGPPPITVEGEEEYEVSRIIAERNGKFLVRWRGYGPDKDTWLKESDLRNAPNVLAEWIAQQ